MRDLFVIFAASFVALSASAGPPLTPLEDRTHWIVLAREVVAVDAASGGEHRAPLGVGERVLATWVDGEIGVAQTDRRLLAVTTRTGGVHEVRFQIGERLLGAPELGDRLAIAITPRRALGFDGGSGNWVEASLGPRERVVATAVANHVAAVVTDRRALALSPVRGGFFEAPLALRESPAQLSATGDLATLQTRTRLLVFRAASARWSERALGIGN